MLEGNLRIRVQCHLRVLAKKHIILVNQLKRAAFHVILKIGRDPYIGIHVRRETTVPGSSFIYLKRIICGKEGICTPLFEYGTGDKPVTGENSPIGSRSGFELENIGGQFRDTFR
jgi:hypothetical protein